MSRCGAGGSRWPLRDRRAASQIRCPMHICYVCRGVFTHIPAYVRFFRGQGHRVSLIHIDRHPVEGAENRSASVGAFDPARGKWKLPLHLPRVAWHLSHLRPDIVHAHYATSAGILAALSGFGPLVVSCHGSDILLGGRDFWRRTAVRIALARARLVHVVSPQVREGVLAVGVPADRILVANVGVPTGRLMVPRPRARGGPVMILCTRHLEPIYDVATLLDALSLLRRRFGGFRCTVAGKGYLEAELRGKAHKLDLDSHVRFLGGYDPEDLPGLLADADVYVSPAHSDGTSLSLLEGMAGGLFPVVTDIPANREWITDGENGILFTPGDPKALARALETACREDELRRAVAGCNRDIVRARGDRDRNMGKIEQAYRMVLSGSGAGRERG
ncbi:MAG: glycosyltransferase family 4 protein [Acidobacteriota bacterium]